MFETKYSKFLTILLVVIIVAIICLGGYLGYSYFESSSKVNDADKYVSNFVEEVSNTTSKNNTDEGEGSISSNIAAAETGSSNSSKTQTYKGFNVLGTIEIPKTNVKYPVLEGPASNDKIEVAVAVQYPLNATLNTEGNVVIAGHNYRNGTFFSNNSKIEIGDKIYITDLSGQTVEYTVYNKYITADSDGSYMIRDTQGKREISLSTCTSDVKQRLVIWASAD